MKPFCAKALGIVTLGLLWYVTSGVVTLTFKRYLPEIARKIANWLCVYAWPLLAFALPFVLRSSYLAMHSSGRHSTSRFHVHIVINRQYTLLRDSGHAWRFVVSYGNPSPQAAERVHPVATRN